MIPMIAVLALDHVHIIKGALPVASHRVEKVSPHTANAFEIRREELIREGQAVNLTAVAEQSQHQLQPVHRGPTEGRIPDMPNNLILFPPNAGQVPLGEGRPLIPHLFDQRTRPLPKGNPVGIRQTLHLPPKFHFRCVS